MKQVDALAGKKGPEIRHSVRSTWKTTQPKKTQETANQHISFRILVLRIEHQFHFWTDKQSNFAVVVCVFFSATFRYKYLVAHHHLKGLFVAKLLDSRSISRVIHIFHGSQYGKRFWICSSLRWCKKAAMTWSVKQRIKQCTHTQWTCSKKIQKHFYSYNVIYYKWILRDIIFWVSMLRSKSYHSTWLQKMDVFLQFIINLAEWNRISPTWICLIFGVGGPRTWGGSL